MLIDRRKCLSILVRSPYFTLKKRCPYTLMLKVTLPKKETYIQHMQGVSHKGKVRSAAI